MPSKQAIVNSSPVSRFVVIWAIVLAGFLLTACSQDDPHLTPYDAVNVARAEVIANSTVPICKNFPPASDGSWRLSDVSLDPKGWWWIRWHPKLPESVEPYSLTFLVHDKDKVVFQQRYAIGNRVQCVDYHPAS